MGYVPEPLRYPEVGTTYVGKQRIPTPVIPPSVDRTLIDGTDYPPLIDAFTLGRIMFTVGLLALPFILLWALTQ